MSPDNFFKKMTDLDSPKKNNDCYFYYYSTCVKGDSCTFRHEPSALGCETMCAYWKEGKCLNVHCNFRHMELRKNRKVIPCYWESQPVGCLKAHCPFMHQNPRPMSHDIEKASISSDGSMGPGMQTQRKVTAVDSVVVKIEEESDNESMPTYSPIKSERIVRVKTSEELKLEEIQAESAAYYSYQDSDLPSLDDPSIDMRHRIVHRMFTNNSTLRKVTLQNPSDSRKRLSDPFMSNRGDSPLRKKQKFVYQNENGGYNIVLKKSPAIPELSVNLMGNNRRVNAKQDAETNIESIKIKTLEEIRAERKTKLKLEEKEESLVSSTITIPEYNSDSMETTVSLKPMMTNDEENTKRKIRLRRKLPLSENVVSNTTREEPREKEETLENKVLDENFLEGESLFEDDRYDISLEAEEDLLNEIDD